MATPVAPDGEQPVLSNTLAPGAFVECELDQLLPVQSHVLDGSPKRKLDGFKFIGSSGRLRSLEDKVCREHVFGVGKVSGFLGKEKLSAQIGPVLTWDIIYDDETAIWVRTPRAWYQLNEVSEVYEDIFSRLFSKFLLSTAVVHALSNDESLSYKQLLIEVQETHKTMGMGLSKDQVKNLMLKNSRFLKCQLGKIRTAPELLPSISELLQRATAARDQSKLEKAERAQKVVDTEPSQSAQELEQIRREREQKREEVRLQRLEEKRIQRMKFPVDDDLIPESMKTEWTAPEPERLPESLEPNDDVFTRVVALHCFLLVFTEEYSLPVFRVSELLELVGSNSGHSVCAWHACLLHASLLRALLGKEKEEFRWPVSSGSETEEKPTKRQKKRKGRVQASWYHPAEKHITCPLSDRDTWPEAVRQYISVVHPNSFELSTCLATTDYSELEPTHRQQIVEVLVGDLLGSERTRLLIDGNTVAAVALGKQRAEGERDCRRRLRELESQATALTEKLRKESVEEEKEINSIETDKEKERDEQQHESLLKKRKMRDGQVARARELVVQEQQDWDQSCEQLDQQIDTLTSYSRMQPLGVDRFYRQYWWLDGCLPDKYLYSCDRSAQNWGRFHKDKIGDIIASLNNKGVREEHLARQLQRLLDNNNNNNNNNISTKCELTPIPGHASLPSVARRFRHVCLHVIANHISQATLKENVTKTQTNKIEMDLKASKDIQQMRKLLLQLEALTQAAAFGAAWEKRRDLWVQRMEGRSSDSVEVSSKVPAHVILFLGVEMETAFGERVAVTACTFCASGNFTKTNQVLLCDTCDKGFHMRCLKPPLSRVPPSDWHCPECLMAKNNSDATTDQTKKKLLDSESESSSSEGFVEKESVPQRGWRRKRNSGRGRSRRN